MGSFKSKIHYQLTHKSKPKNKLVISEDGRSFGFKSPWICPFCKQKFKENTPDFHKSLCPERSIGTWNDHHWEIKECAATDEYLKSDAYKRLSITGPTIRTTRNECNDCNDCKKYCFNGFVD